MKILVGNQINPIGSDVLARISIVRPILYALTVGIKQDVLNLFGGFSNIKLGMLPRAYRKGDGDIGFCFEWAIHDAIKRQDPIVMERLEDAAKLCKLTGRSYQSILFGLEKTGKTRIIDTANEILTEESRILTGAQAQPPKLKIHMNRLASAFHRPETRASLPSSINGLWKADLFFGSTESDRWLGTTLKINPRHLEGAKGLRIGIVPATHGSTDRVYKDEKKNLVICPIPYDGAFMELFYIGWGIVQQFLASDAKLPKAVNLPNTADRQVAKELEARRDYPVIDVIEALDVLSQPDLLHTNELEVGSTTEREGEQALNDLLLSPVATYKY